MWLTLEAYPNCSAAAALSPPPIIVAAPSVVNLAKFIIKMIILYLFLIYIKIDY